MKVCGPLAFCQWFWSQLGSLDEEGAFPAQDFRGLESEPASEAEEDPPQTPPPEPVYRYVRVFDRRSTKSCLWVDQRSRKRTCRSRPTMLVTMGVDEKEGGLQFEREIRPLCGRHLKQTKSAGAVLFAIEKAPVIKDEEPIPEPQSPVRPVQVVVEAPAPHPVEMVEGPVPIPPAPEQAAQMSLEIPEFVPLHRPEDQGVNEAQ